MGKLDDVNPDAVAAEGHATDDEEDLDTSAGETEGTETEESQEGQAEGDNDEYELDGVKFTSKQLKDWAQKDAEYKNWDAAHHKKGLELNTKERKLKESIEKHQEDLALVTEYKEFKSFLDAHPDVKKQLAGMMDSPQTKVSLMLKEAETRFSERERAAAEKEAIADLKAEFPDYNPEASQSVLQEFDWDNPRDVFRGAYYLYLGKNLEKIVEERLIKAGAARNKAPKTPPLAGSSKKSGTTREIKSLDDGLEAYFQDHPR